MNCILKECPMFGDLKNNHCVVYGDPAECRLLKKIRAYEHVISCLDGYTTKSGINESD